MAIEWKKRVTNTETGKEEWVDDGVTHEGLVMGPTYTREVRVMSDIYADVTYVTVWNPETERPTDVAIAHHFELGTRRGTPTIDIDPAIADAWAEKVKAESAAHAKAEAARREREREESARDRLLEVRKGAEAVVVKGRKVPVGTRGTIIWTGSGNYGPRVGIKEASGDVHWTAESNVKVVFPGMGPDDTPEGGWAALEREMSNARSEWSATFPVKGSRVRHIESGVAGKVMWAKAERLGVKRPGGKDDILWCNAWEVAVLESDGSERLVEREPRNVPIKVAAPARPAAKKTPKGYTDMSVPANPVPEALASMPAPYCDIREVREEKDGTYSALDSSGNFLVKLPASSASKISALLAG
jgi:hypothetical protein